MKLPARCAESSQVATFLSHGRFQDEHFGDAAAFESCVLL